VARVLFSGEVHTRPTTIRREIKLKTGQPLSEGAVVDTQRKLYGLGIFNRVSIAPQNPAGTDTDKTVDVLVEEAQRYTIAYGLGFEVQRIGSAGTGPVAEPLNFSPRVTFEATKLNLTGRADTLCIQNSRKHAARARPPRYTRCRTTFGSAQLGARTSTLSMTRRATC
jgi:outer membrane protein insertion porin family